jgi:hypothetical protein
MYHNMCSISTNVASLFLLWVKKANIRPDHFLVTSEKLKIAWELILHDLLKKSIIKVVKTLQGDSEHVCALLLDTLTHVMMHY